MTVVSGRRAARSRPSPAVFFALLGVAATLVLGTVLSRPDLIAVGLPLALWSVRALRPQADEVSISIERVDDAEPGWVADDVVIDSRAELVELALVQGERTRRRVFVAGRARVHARSRTLHSGPLRSVEAAARPLHADGGSLGRSGDPTVMTRAIPSVSERLPRLPLAPRLTGLHGAHEGTRPGQGGDFRDIHQFAPGDELRRVDWKATARAARRPGELLIRRTNTLSDASAVVVMDTADDLGAVVATWGSLDLERSGVTSLDHARSAARSIAEAVVGQGDRVAFHTLMLGGRSVRSGAGRRHLARVLAEIAATGRGGDDARFRRTPPVPHGSIIYVLSTFFDGAAAEIATRWRAVGHRVVAVDTLPELDRTRLTTARGLALDVLLAERQDMLQQLQESGVERISWTDAPAGTAAALSRVHRAPGGGVRR